MSQAPTTDDTSASTTADTSAPSAAGAPRATLHDQIADVLRWRIARGVYPPGLAIPTWPAIGAEFGVGASTTVRVSRILRAEKLIDGIPMQGTFVRTDLPPLTVPDTEPAVVRSFQPRSRPDSEPGEDGEDTGYVGNQRLAEWVQEVLTARIAAGRYRPGERIPGHRLLSDELGVGRNSVDIAMKALQRAGLVTAERLKGSFVATDLPADLGPTTEPPRPAGGRPGAGPVTFGAFGEDTAAFGAALAARRRAARLTQGEASVEIGIARTTLAELEKGYLRAPSPQKVALALAWLEGRAAGGGGVTVAAGPAVTSAARRPEPAAAPVGRRVFLSYTYLDGLGERVYDRTIINLFDPPDRLETLEGVEAALGDRHGVEDAHVKILFFQLLGDR